MGAVRGRCRRALMCRVLAYLGSPVLIDKLLFAADVSLVRQTIAPRMMRLLNLGGFGLAAWDPGSPDPARPFTYRTAAVPMFDRNLKSLASKVYASALLAHVRGVVYQPSERVGTQQVHPFRFYGAPFALAMNGDLFDFARMRYDLLEHIPAALSSQIEGTTDSEWFFAARARATRRSAQALHGSGDGRGGAASARDRARRTGASRDRYAVADHPRARRRAEPCRHPVRVRLRLVSARRLVLRRREAVANPGPDHLPGCVGRQGFATALRPTATLRSPRAAGGLSRSVPHPTTTLRDPHATQGLSRSVPTEAVAIPRRSTHHKLRIRIRTLQTSFRCMVRQRFCDSLQSASTTTRPSTMSPRSVARGATNRGAPMLIVRRGRWSSPPLRAAARGSRGVGVRARILDADRQPRR